MLLFLFDFPGTVQDCCTIDWMGTVWMLRVDSEIKKVKMLLGMKEVAKIKLMLVKESKIVSWDERTDSNKVNVKGNLYPIA